MKKTNKSKQLSMSHGEALFAINNTIAYIKKEMLNNSYSPDVLFLCQIDKLREVRDNYPLFYEKLYEKIRYQSFNPENFSPTLTYVISVLPDDIELLTVEERKKVSIEPAIENIYNLYKYQLIGDHNIRIKLDNLIRIKFLEDLIESIIKQITK